MSFRRNTFNRASKKHLYKGSLVQHIAVEDTLNFLSKPTSIFLRHTRCLAVYKLMRVPFVIGWGVNCGFGWRDSTRYLVWWLRKEGL